MGQGEREVGRWVNCGGKHSIQVHAAATLSVENAAAAASDTHKDGARLETASVSFNFLIAVGGGRQVT